MTTLTERYNRKRTPVVQRRELSTTPLVEPEVAGSQNPIAPTVDNTDETAPQASVVEPQINDYQWNQRLYETLFQKPISQEEEERRKRSRPGNRDAYDFEHQAGLLALELENSRINSNARLQKISYERLFIENKRKSIRHFD